MGENRKNRSDALNVVNNKSPKPISDDELKSILGSYEKPADWHKDIIALNKTHSDMKLPKDINSNQALMVNFLAHHPAYAFSRRDLESIAIVLGVESDDIIQSVNKTTQWGLNRWSEKILGVTYYSMPKIEYISKHTRPIYEKLDDATKVNSEIKVRSYFKFLSEEKEYQVGHKDPRKELSSGNFVMQPKSVNNPNKDKYIFNDNSMMVSINPEKFIEDPSLFYTNEDLMLIYEALKRRFSDI